MEPTVDETECIARAREGDTEAFAALVALHEGRIYGVIQRLVRDREKALDLTQEVFMKAWRGLARFEGQSAFYTWLYRIGRNVVTSAARYDAARPKIRVSLDDGGDDEGRRGAPEPTAESEAPEAAAIGEEERQAVRQAIADLPEEAREIVVLRDLAGHAYEEIAEMLDIPVGTVRSRLHRARQELRARLARLMRMEPPEADAPNLP